LQQEKCREGLRKGRQKNFLTQRTFYGCKEGEVCQLEKGQHPTLKEDDYFRTEKEREKGGGEGPAGTRSSTAGTNRVNKRKGFPAGEKRKIPSHGAGGARRERDKSGEIYWQTPNGGP